jgi:peptide/nickel transport system substrate-binding protein
MHSQEAPVIRSAVTRPTLALVPVLVAFVLAATAVAAGNLRIAASSEAPSLDIHATPSTTTYHDLVYATLVTRDLESGAFIPYLATSWELLDEGRSIRFELRDDVLFHDGTRFDAEAVKFSFERLLDPEMSAPGASFAGTLERVEVVDPTTVILHYGSVYAPALLNLSATFLGIVSPTAVATLGDGFAQRPVSAGPFKFGQVVPGDRIVLERFDDYAWAPSIYENQGASYIETITFQVIPDDATQLLLLQTNGIDVAGAPPRDVQRLIARDDVGPGRDLQLLTFVTPGIRYLGQTSCCGRPTADPAVRRAVAHAIEREEIMLAALEGFGTTLTGLFAPTTWGFDPDMVGYPYAPETARAILREAGYAEDADGFMAKDGQRLTLVLWTYNLPEYQRASQVVQAQLADAGIDVDLQLLESATLLAGTKLAEHDLLLIAYGWADAGILSFFFGSDRLQTSNRVHFARDDVDALLAAGNATVDVDERFAIYQDLQRLILDEAPWVPLYTVEVLNLVRSEVEGVRVHPFMGRLLYHDAYIGTRD